MQVLLLTLLGPRHKQQRQQGQQQQEEFLQGTAAEQQPPTCACLTRAVPQSTAVQKLTLAYQQTQVLACIRPGSLHLLAEHSQCQRQQEQQQPEQNRLQHQHRSAETVNMQREL